MRSTFWIAISWTLMNARVPDSKTTRVVVIPISSWRHKRWLDIAPTSTWVVLLSEYSGVPSAVWNSKQLTLMKCVMNKDQLDHRKIFHWFQNKFHNSLPLMLYRDFNPESNNSLYIFPSISIEQYFPLIEGTPRPDYCDARLYYSSQSCPCKHAFMGQH